MSLWTTWGSARGCCGHEHASEDLAEQCMARDADGCSVQGGYSDRVVREIGAGGTRSYDVTTGPGRRRPGRPSTGRTDAVLVRLTPAEREAIDAAAGDASTAEYIRDAALARARRAR